MDMQWSEAFDIEALMAEEDESVLPMLKPKVVGAGCGADGSGN